MSATSRQNQFHFKWNAIGELCRSVLIGKKYRRWRLQRQEMRNLKVSFNTKRHSLFPVLKILEKKSLKCSAHLRLSNTLGWEPMTLGWRTKLFSPWSPVEIQKFTFCRCPNHWPHLPPLTWAKGKRDRKVLLVPSLYMEGHCSISEAPHFQWINT